MHEDNKFKQYIDEIELPQNTEETWLEGIKKAKKEEEGISLKKTIKRSGIVAALLAIGILIGVKTSPTFAAGLEELIFGKKVEQYTEDTDFIKSREEGIGVKLNEAVVEESDDEISYEVEGDNLKLRMIEAYADSSNLFLVYEIEADKKVYNEHVFFLTLEPKGIVDGEGVRIGGNNMRTRNIEKVEEDGNVIYRGYMQISEKIRFDLKKNIRLEMKLDSYNVNTSERKNILSNTEFVFPEIEFKEEAYDLNAEIVIEKEKVTFEKITISPLRTTLEFNMSSDVSFNISEIKKVTLRDGKGNRWVNIVNETNGNMLDVENKLIKMRVNMESPYYNEPEELFLESIVMQVLDKDKSKFEVDTINMKVQEPYDKKIELLSVKEEEEDILMEIKYFDIDDIEEFQFRLTNIMNEKEFLATESKELEVSSKYEYFENYAIRTMKFKKSLLKDKIEFKIYKGVGEILEYNLNYKIK